MLSSGNTVEEKKGEVPAFMELSFKREKQTFNKR